MKLNVICMQGRVGDRTEGTMVGAALTAKAFEQEYGVKAQVVGQYYPAANDNWRTSLLQANEALNKLADSLSKSIECSDLTFVAANTCSASLATLPVVLHHHPETVVLWFDAHGDFNIPDTTDSGYLGGMVVAGICGLWDSGHGSGVRTSQVILVGAHDLDKAEAALIKQAGVRVIHPSDVTPEAILSAIGQAKVWIHVDWDVLEPGYIPADYKVTGGMHLKQMQDVFAAIPVERILGFEFAEYQAPEDEDERKDAISNIVETFSALIKY